MEIQLTPGDHSEVTLTVSVPYSDVLAAEEKSFDKLRKNLKVSGFRAGKVPEAVARSQISSADIRAQMLEDALPKWYVAAVQEKNLHVIASPELSIESVDEGKPLVFKATVPVFPEVKLGDYQSIRASRKEDKVTKQQIEETLDALRGQRATYELREKATENGDVAVMDVEAKLGEEVLKAYTREDYELVLGEGYFVPNFDKEVLGMKAGDKRTFALTLPEDYPLERFQNQKIDFAVTLKGTKVRVLPELDDALAKELGAKDLADLNHQVEHSLEHKHEDENRREFENTVLEQLDKQTTVAVPHLLVEEEMNKMAHEFDYRLRQRGLTMEGYLNSRGQQREDLEKEWQPQAETIARLGLILDAVARAETITTTPEELAQELTSWLVSYRDDKGKLTKEGSQIEKNLNSEKGQSYLTQMLRRAKTRARLFEIAEGKKGKSEKKEEDSKEEEQMASSK